MYESFYGLTERPFDLTPNPRFLFLSERQREALSNLRYGLTTPRGLTLLLGEAGTGKTTLVQAALEGLSSAKVSGVLISNPTLTRGEFYESLAQVFNLSEAAAGSKARFLLELRSLLLERFSVGELSAVVFDEAQSLPDELLEEVRLLSNMETTTDKLLNVVLAGQPELADRLNRPSLRQLKQRISLRCELRPLDLQETAAYISGRLRIAGGTPAGIFTRAAVTMIYQGSGGVPRTVNVICDNTLISGFASQAKPVSRGVVEEVIRDFNLQTRRLPLEEIHRDLQWLERDGEVAAPLAAAAAAGPTARTPESAVASAAGSGTAPSDQMFEMFNRKKRFPFFRADR